MLYNHVVHGQSLTTPLNLQYLQHKVEGEEVLATFSDGSHTTEMVISTKYDFLFINKKVPENDVISITELKRKKGKMIVKGMAMLRDKSKKFKRFGKPANL